MTKEFELLRRIEQFERETALLKEKLKDVRAELDDVKNWKEKCDRVALKYGSFAMGVLTLGAIILIGLDKAWDRLGEILIAWGLK